MTLLREARGPVASGGAASAVDWLWVLAWGVGSSAWCVTAARQLSATFDEPLYILRGLQGWRGGTHSGLLKAGTMPLPVDVCTFPLYLWERWHGALLDPVAGLPDVLPWARAGTLVFWWVLLVYGWRIGWQLGGRWSARLAVALLACEPSLLAHASLATTDIAISACLLALLYHFRTGREANWVRRAGLPAWWCAACVLAKASGLFYAPICLCVVELERVAHAAVPDAAADRLACFRRDLVAIMGGGLLLVFLYCGTDWRPEPSFVAWAHGLPDATVVGRSTVWLAEHLRIFSNAGEGLVRQVRHGMRGHSYGAYLLGEVRPFFWYYFPVALSIKLSLPVLLLPAIVLVVWPRALVNWATLAAAALLAFSLTSRVQIGVRFMLPLVAVALVGLAGAIVRACNDGPPWSRRVLVVAASVGVAWTAVAAARVWPDGLRYANEFWGGTARGYLHLSDSNCDWGQGLTELRRWQEAHGVAPLDVWYFGTDPAVHTLPLREMPLHVLPIATRDDVARAVRGRRLAASTTLLYGTVMNPAHRAAAAFLRSCHPVGRTSTFFIYDFTPEPYDGETRQN